MDQRTPDLQELAPQSECASLHSATTGGVALGTGPVILRQRDQRTLHGFLLLLSVLLAFVSVWRGVDTPLPDLSEGQPITYHPRIGVNHCDWPELCLLPGISDTLARRIVAHRQQHGPFSQPQDLERIRGIGPKTSASLARLLDFSCPSIPLGASDISGTCPLQ